jgi:hypothetical protein
MARETKQEHTVRTMTDQVSEHMIELKTLIANPNCKEADVERWSQSLLRSCLGFSATNGYTIRAQETRGKMRPDLIVCKNDKPLFVVEVKRLGFDLGKTDFRSGKMQLGEYLHGMPDVRWGFLTNGVDWKLFDFSNKNCRGVEVITVDLRNDAGEIDTSKRGIEDTCWELFDLHENCFTDGSWDELFKEASAFSPDSLARAILSADVVKVIAKTIRGEHEYKANPEALLDRLVEVVCNGLDDVDQAWNENKMLELSKFVKAQKRATRSKRRASKKAEEVPTAEEAIQAERAADASAKAATSVEPTLVAAPVDPTKVSA